jgi:asparagine synthase (glutamine-hydrolysing)
VEEAQVTRYFSVVWNPRVTGAKELIGHVERCLAHRSPPLEIALSNPGLFLLTEKLSPGGKVGPTLLNTWTGAVVGTIFRRDSFQALPTSRFSEFDSREIDRTRGGALIKSFWGSYVAFLQSTEGGITRVLRSPVSHLPCYYTAFRNVHIIFSHIDDLRSLELISLSINWDRITAQASMLDFLNGETGLVDVFALESGTCLEIGDSGCKVRMYWRPNPNLWRHPIGGFEDAAATLRDTVISCTSALSAAHDSVLVQLSGGLDSSIVLTALARTRSQRRLSCVNYYSDLSGDERRYARSMADKWQVPLVEHERTPDFDLRRILNCARTASPVLNFSAFDTAPKNALLASQCGATALFDGELGDNVFGSGVQHEVFEEYLRTAGLNGHALRVALEFAILHRVSIWRVFHRGIRDGLFKRPATSWNTEDYVKTLVDVRADERLISEDSLMLHRSRRARFEHPWFKDVGDIPAGKQQLTYALQVITSSCYEAPFPEAIDLPTISPLSAQPVVELALAIPSHFHIRNAVNRSLARTAFENDLSEDVLFRGNAKGGPDLWLQDIVARNRSFLRETLLDGVLVQRGILDRHKVERRFAENPQRVSPRATEVIVQLYIEAWARNWSYEMKSHAA